MKRRPFVWWPRDRRQAQSGATLIELLVSVVIMGLALTLIIGTFSTGLLQSTLSKRNTAALTATQYELEQISGTAYGDLPSRYSDCFPTEDASRPPTRTSSYGDPCNPSSAFTLRLDVTSASGPVASSQTWTITVRTWPGAAKLGDIVQTIKVNR
jgi:type II secretory pathway pseudopilin PulG